MTVTSAPAATSCPTSCDSLSVIAACLQVILVQLLPDTAGQVRPAREVFRQVGGSAGGSGTAVQHPGELLLLGQLAPHLDLTDGMCCLQN